MDMGERRGVYGRFETSSIVAAYFAMTARKGRRVEIAGG
jgi:hypothetical protein